jgi:predicted nucleotidyltransferase
MRITKDQLVAGYPVLEVRSFIRRQRLGTFAAPAAEHAMKLSLSEAEDFLRELVNLGYLEQARPIFGENIAAYEVTQQGQALANASGAKPISRETADRALQEFMERVQTINASREYAYQIESVVLFGSMLSSAERLGDVDLAIELKPAILGDEEFDERCNVRRRAAQADGKRFTSTFEWVTWPQKEIILFLKSRSRTLSLHDLHDLTSMNDIQCRVLLGNSRRLMKMIPGQFSS